MNHDDVVAKELAQHFIFHGRVYSEEVARKAVSQFLKSKDPRIGMLRRFAAAAGLDIDELVAEPKPARRKK
ncbi:MAG TPA: hypothetical protein VKE40_03140 [Gemmataceae bacterium]|nr:hypothetical protein [Gemmataceae bacterium]